MGFDLSGHAAGYPAGSAPSYAASGFDWHGLHARLAAAHVARRSILELAQAPARLGSFDGRAAATLAEHEPFELCASLAVNPTDLADGKEPARIAADVAGPSISGDRGK
ncbi:MAG TPA: hypothetical protein VHG29_02590 [Novosphingobium sp.]|nr:hypothetical protein [Novosphingobium sp.]